MSVGWRVPSKIFIGQTWTLDEIFFEMGTQNLFDKPYVAENLEFDSMFLLKHGIRKPLEGLLPFKYLWYQYIVFFIHGR